MSLWEQMPNRSQRVYGKALSCCSAAGGFRLLASSEDRDNVCPGGVGVQTQPRTRSCSAGTHKTGTAGISIPSRSCLLWPAYLSCISIIPAIPPTLRSTWGQQQQSQPRVDPRWECLPREGRVEQDPLGAQHSWEEKQQRRSLRGIT